MLPPAPRPIRRKRPRTHPRARKRQPRQRPGGFTLVEIIVVIAVIAVLASLVAPNVFRHVDAARDTTARSQVEMLGAALDAFRLDVGRYPTTEEGLGALLSAPSGIQNGAWKGPYLRKKVPVDPWMNPYRYTSPGRMNPGYDLLSWGADGRPGGEGENADVTSWE